MTATKLADRALVVFLLALMARILFAALAPVSQADAAKAEACAWTHDANPHWDDGRPMTAEDCTYMGGEGW